jgi:hypothetical protein
MFVGNDDPGQLTGMNAQAPEPEGRLAQAEPAIEEDSRGTALDEQRVTRAATAERCEADHFNC